LAVLYAFRPLEILQAFAEALVVPLQSAAYGMGLHLIARSQCKSLKGLLL